MWGLFSVFLSPLVIWKKIITFGIIYLFLLTGVSHKIHFFMKKVFAALAALAMMAAVVSCEYDSPDIRFQQTTNLTNDYSALVNALLDQTKTVSEKLNLLEKAINNQTFTLEQKIELLTKAYESGVIKYEELIGKAIAAINSMSTSIAEKLAAIENALKTQTSDLSAKLALIESSVKLGFADNAKAIDLVRTAIGSLQGSLEEKLAAVEKAVKDQTMDLSAKLVLIEGAVKTGLADNAEAIKLVKQAVESLEGTVEEKLKAINETIESQTNTLSGKLAAIQGSLDAGLVGEDSTLGLVKKAIDALNATAGTANDKLDAIKNAIDSPTSGLNVKLEAIEEALSQGLIDVTKKQDLILAALNSASTYHFTDDELLEKGQDYLLVDAAFWEANHENYEVVRKLKELIKLSVPHKYKFWIKLPSGKYPISGSEDTSFYGPLYTEGGIMKDIMNSGEVILAVDCDSYLNPKWHTVNGHKCYYLKKVHKGCRYNFVVKVGERAAGKKLKVEGMNSKDRFIQVTYAQVGECIEYWHRSDAVKTRTGVWGFQELQYYPYQYPDNSVEFIIVEDN